MNLSNLSPSKVSPFLLFLSQLRRLYEEAAARKAREIDRSLRPPEGCSFRPSISSPLINSPKRSKSPEGIPSKETTSTPRKGNTPTRLYESSKQKNEKLELLKKKVEQDRLGIFFFFPLSLILLNFLCSSHLFQQLNVLFDLMFHVQFELLNRHLSHQIVFL